MSLTSMQRDVGHNTEKKFEMDPVYFKQKLPSMPSISSTPFKSEPSDSSVDADSASPNTAAGPPKPIATTIQASTNLSVTVASDFSLYPDDLNITICGSTLNGLKLYPTPIVVRPLSSKDITNDTGEVKPPPLPEVAAPVLRTGRSGSKLALALKQNSQPSGSQNSDPNDTGQDNEDEMAALMAASSTIKGNKKKQFPQVPNPAAIRKKKLKELKDAQLVLSMIDPEKEYFREENRKNLASAFFYLMKDRMEENKDTELFNEIVETLTEFDADITPVTEFYGKMTDLLKNYPELAQQFVTFLLPEQAWECGKFFEYIKIENMRKFVKKIKAFFAKQPQLFRLVFAALENLSDNENVTLEEVKSTIIPLLKGNSVLIDSFLMLIPQGRPPESLMSVDVEDMDFDSDNSGNEEEKLVLPNQPDVYGNDHCICFCHNSTDDKFRTRFFHCVSCGTRFIQGRVYLQTARHSRLANVAFPEDECQAKRIYLKKIPPKTRGRRPMKKPIETRENNDAAQAEDPMVFTPEAAQSSAAKDPNTPTSSSTPSYSANSDPKRSKTSNDKSQKSAARSLDMSSSVHGSSSNCLANDSGIGVMHLSESLLNQPQGIYSLDQEFVTVDAFNHNQRITEGTNVLSELGCRMVTTTLENVSDGLGTFDYNASENININNSITTYSVNNSTLDLFDLQGAVPLENVACVAMDTYDGELCSTENSGDFITLEVYNNNVEMGTMLNAQNVVAQESCSDSKQVDRVLVPEETMDTSYVAPLPVHLGKMEVDNHPSLSENDSSVLTTTFNVLAENNSVLPVIANQQSSTLITKTINLPVATNLEPIVVVNHQAGDFYQATSEPVVLLSTVSCEHSVKSITPENGEESAEGIVPEKSAEKSSAEISERPFEILLPTCENAAEKIILNCRSITGIDDNFLSANNVILPKSCENANKEIMPEMSTEEIKIMPDIPKKSTVEKISAKSCEVAAKVTAPENCEKKGEAITPENPLECDGVTMKEATRREPLPWTKDEDKVILLEVQRGYCLDKTFQNMTGLPERSLAEIRERFQLLMRMLQEMTHRKGDT